MCETEVLLPHESGGSLKEGVLPEQIGTLPSDIVNTDLFDDSASSENSAVVYCRKRKRTLDREAAGLDNDFTEFIEDEDRRHRLLRQDDEDEDQARAPLHREWWGNYRAK